ncbi:MAG TPA: hypothetical protein VFA07_08775 [Chthonomonadaceae bacterium]|nr:hypothetical protein [Chthonomonadaceae bacterium]
MLPRNRPARETEARLYLRLLAREADAPSDLADAYLGPLLDALHSHFPDIPDLTLVDDIVENTLLRFPKEPEKYNPARSSLWTYLYMDALGDIKNALDSAKRQERKLRLVSLDRDVAESEPDRKGELEEMMIRQEVPDYLPDGVEIHEVRAEVEVIISNATDLAVAELQLAGERKTEAYAKALGITNMPVDEQRRRVKQEKDKWRARWRRLGVKFDAQ